MLPIIVPMFVAALATFPSQDPDQARIMPPLVDLAELQIVQYQPEHVDVRELEELVIDMVGREFYVRERGGYSAGGVTNVRLLGRGLVLYDTQEYVDRMLQALVKLDQPRPGEKPKAYPHAEELFEYIPRYLSLDAVLHALDSYGRQVIDGEQWVDNFSRARERSLLIVRESSVRIAEIKAVLARIDVPEAQVVVTCQLIRGVGRGEDTGVASELLGHLKALLPEMTFQAAGFSMLQSSVTPNQRVNLLIQDDKGASFTLSFTPVAFDRETGSLSVVKCSLETTGQPHGRQLFSTATIFRGGEYTVLGATGTEPVFAVVRVQPVH